MLRFGRQDGGPTLVELLHAIRKSPHLALLPRHFLFDQHHAHRFESGEHYEHAGGRSILLQRADTPAPNAYCTFSRLSPMHANRSTLLEPWCE